MNDNKFLVGLAGIYNKAQKQDIDKFMVGKQMIKAFGCSTVSEFMDTYGDLKFIYRLAEIFDIKFIHFKRVRRQKGDRYYYENIPVNKFYISVHFDDIMEDVELDYPKQMKQLRHFTKNPNINKRRDSINWDLRKDGKLGGWI